MDWMTLICIVLWGLLGESLRMSLILAGEIIDAPKSKFLKDIPKPIFWLIGPFMFVYAILVRKGED